MTVGLKLKVLRVEQELRQEDVAKKVDLSLTGYRNIETGQSVPTVGTLIKLADLYNVSLDYLTGRSDIRHVN